MKSQIEQAQQLGNLWLEMMTKMMSAAVTTDPKQPPPDAARHLRDVSLAAIGQQVDKYLRSPQFLELAKQSLDAQIAWRNQINQFLTDAHHSVQGVAKPDVDALSLSVRQMERRVLNRIEALGERLDQISQRLEAMEAESDSDGGHDDNGAADGAADGGAGGAGGAGGGGDADHNGHATSRISDAALDAENGGMP